MLTSSLAAALSCSGAIRHVGISSLPYSAVLIGVGMGAMRALQTRQKRQSLKGLLSFKKPVIAGSRKSFLNQFDVVIKNSCLMTSVPTMVRSRWNDWLFWHWFEQCIDTWTSYFSRSSFIWQTPLPNSSSHSTEQSNFIFKFASGVFDSMHFARSRSIVNVSSTVNSNN